MYPLFDAYHWKLSLSLLAVGVMAQKAWMELPMENVTKMTAQETGRKNYDPPFEILHVLHDVGPCVYRKIQIYSPLRLLGDLRNHHHQPFAVSAQAVCSEEKLG
jgi:hypothetical protein